MRPAAGVVAAALLAAVGAVILGEYDLGGRTAVFGFPLFALAVTELAIAVGGRLRALAGVVAAIVGAALVWALWISYNHFRRDQPPPLSWVMLAVAVALSLFWARAGHPSHTEDPPPDPAP